MFNLRNILCKTAICLITIMLLFGSETAFSNPFHNPDIRLLRSNGFHQNPFFRKDLHKQRSPKMYDTFLPPLFRGLPYITLANIAHRKQETTLVIVPALPTYSKGTFIDRTTGNTLNINIPNSNGSYTSVVLTKYGSGFLEPQGEYYPTPPAVEQLRFLYAN